MQKILIGRTAVRFGLVAVFFLFLFNYVSADCGNINTIDPFGEAISTPIEDCDNPFEATDSVSFNATLFLGEEVVVNGAELAIATTSQVMGLYEIDKGFNFAFSPFQLFQKEGADYFQLTAPRTSGFSLDGLSAGTYVAVFTYEQAPVLSEGKKSWWQTIVEWMLPQPALASPGFGKEILVWEFTVVAEEIAPPAGASSVLFLPGIQASRLYTDGVLGTENRLWEPNRDNDVEKLAMTEAGHSINDIYTREVIDEVFGVGNIYQGLLDMLEELKANGSIADFEPFAYDWRYDVFTIATEPVSYPSGENKLLLDEIKRLAADSHTGKVTIVAHSNGGLVAKALMSEYQDNELSGLVEKVIMVGTPQLGTPLAIGSLLHGTEQSKVFEILVSQNTARNTTKYMPGAYGLLPSKTYFTNSDEPIITSDDSVSALPISSYGNLKEYDNFVSFLIDENNTRSLVINVTQPISLNTTILDNTVANQTILDRWIAPDDVQVFEVAGTGNATISGFNYREFKCNDTNAFCVLVPFLKPVPKFTLEGDSTVVFRSATAYRENKIKYSINLEKERLFGSKKHANITESDTVAAFLESALLYPQVTDTLVAEEFSSISETYTIIGVHSPVSILVKNSKGKEVGRVGTKVKEEISGSSYFEVAGSKYVIVPNDEEIEVILTGESDGRYSLTIEELTSEGEQNFLQEVLGATSTATMQASFECKAGVCGELVVDYNSDGQIDSTFDWVGNYETLQEPDVEVEKESEVEVGSGGSTGTRVRPPSMPEGEVAGIATNIPQSELQRMWEQVMEIKELLDRLEIEITNKN